MGISKSYEQLLEQFSSFLNQDVPELDSQRKSFLECSGLNHKELVNSSILEFYFDPNEQHGFGNTFLQSLLSFIDEKKRLRVENKFEVVEIVREQPSESGRIDLVIYGYPEDSDDPQCVIILENKIHHSVSNPFEDYWESIREVSNKNKIGILLTLTQESSPKNFINITHQQLIERVFKKIGSKLSNCDDRHLLFLKDYKLTIDNITNPPKMDNTIKFLFNNGPKIQEIQELTDSSFNTIKDQVKSKLNDINNHGIEYSYQSKSPTNCYLISKQDGIEIRTWINFEVIFSDKEFYIYSYIQTRNYNDFGNHFENHRTRYSNLNWCKDVSVLEIEEWSGCVLFGEQTYDHVTIKDVQNFGELIEKIMVKTFIPFEKNIRKEYLKFNKARGNHD